MSVIKEVIKNVPDYEFFKTVDELNESSRKLAERFPDLVKFYQIGESMAGDPIYCLKIGNGSKAVLMYGFPHPNEPIGSMMLEYLPGFVTKSYESVTTVFETRCRREFIIF